MVFDLVDWIDIADFILILIGGTIALSILRRFRGTAMYPGVVWLLLAGAVYAVHESTNVAFEQVLSQSSIALLHSLTEMVYTVTLLIGIYKLVKISPGSLLQTLSFKELLQAKRAMMVDSTVIAKIEETLLGVFGPSTASILHTSGSKSGKSNALAMLGDKVSYREAVDRLVANKENENWGKIKIGKIDPLLKSGEFYVLDSFEARGVKSDSPSCHYLRGYISGFLSEILETPIIVKEKKCSAMGDNRCEFTFQKIHT